MAVERTQVVVVGAGPTGLTVANLLRAAGIGCVLLEEQSRAFIERRPRAGFIEEGAVRALEAHGLADRLLRTAQTQDSFEFRVEGVRHVVRYGELSGHRHFVYPQQNLVTDLVASHVDGGGDVRFAVRDVRLHDLETDRPAVTYEDEGGRPHRIECDFVAGCDGARGVSRGYLAAAGGSSPHTTTASAGSPCWRRRRRPRPGSSSAFTRAGSPRTWRAVRRSRASTSSARPETVRRTGPRSGCMRNCGAG